MTRLSLNLLLITGLLLLAAAGCVRRSHVQGASQELSQAHSFIFVGRCAEVTEDKAAGRLVLGFDGTARMLYLPYNHPHYAAYRRLLLDGLKAKTEFALTFHPSDGEIIALQKHHRQP
jgi:hypothetical protein